MSSSSKAARRQAIRDAVAASSNPWPLVGRARSLMEYRELCDLATALEGRAAARAYVAQDHDEGRHAQPHPDCTACDRAECEREG